MEEFPPRSKEARLADIEVFAKIWFYPKSVFRFIHEDEYDKYVVLLLVLVGISNAFEQASARAMGNKMPMVAVIVLCIIFGALLGWIGSFIYASLLSWTGGWLKGKATTDDMVKVIAYSNIPVVCSLAILPISILINGNGMFRQSSELVNDSLVTLLNSGLMVVDLGLTLWTLVLTTVGVAVMQQFSLWKAILNVLLPMLILLVPLLALLLLMQVSGA